MADDRELKLRCHELAARLLMAANISDVNQVIAIGAQIYATLPPGPGASKTKKNLVKALERESRALQSQT